MTHRQACPFCETSQAFPLRHRQHHESAEVIEVYIHCTMCPFQKTLRLSTKRLEELRHTAERVKAWGDAQEKRYGVRFEGNRQSLARINAMIAIETIKLP
jgi:hypothetical protein